MKLLHLTPIKYLDSIMTHGLLPSEIKLKHHKKAFNRDGLKGDKCIYLWNPDTSCSTDKVIRDFIYCKAFIHPRNNMVDDRLKLNKKLWDDGKIENWSDDKHWIDFEKFGAELYGSDENYVLFEIDSENSIDLIDREYYHFQTKSEDKFDSCYLLNPFYEHDDKVLHIAKHKIHPDKLKIVGEVATRIYKNNTVGINYKKGS